MVLDDRHSRTGVSDFVYRMIALFVSVVSGIGSKTLWFYGLEWIWCIGMAIAKEKREIAYYKEYIYTAFCTAIALYSIHTFEIDYIVFLPTYPNLDTYFHSRSISSRYGSLSAVVRGPNMPL